MDSIYNVPLIPQNLRQEEAIVQIADALKYLSEVSNDIFARVNKRIESNEEQLKNVMDRINGARTKVIKLTGAKNATQVFSSSKYPAADVHRQYVTLFDHTKLEFSRTKVKFKSLEVKDEPLDTLQFYHVKVDDPPSRSMDGLGSIPNDLTFVNDLFLYNTGKNPYKNYVMSDPLQVSSRLKKEEYKDPSGIGAAPHSISERATLTRTKTEAYFYSPDLGSVPTIDVPLDLPDLPGVADDLRYIDVHEPGIAPSVLSTPNIPELPQLEEVLLPPTELLPPPPPALLETPVEVVKIQEPPPRQVIVKEPEVIRTVEEPVIAIASSSKVKKSEAKKSEAKKPVVEDDAHASLMAAIRNAGGLKNAKLRVSEPTTVVAPTGDLMADLHTKLLLRRKGISGSKNQENSSELDSNSTMKKISAMIPPPSATTESESTNTEDEDWD